MSIEVKDRGNEEAARLTIELIKKYDRYAITVCGSEESWWTRRMLKMDPKLATVAGKTDILKLIFTYWLGLLPYVHFEREAFLLPYMTRDFIKMKENERAKAKSWGERAFLTFYIYFGQLANITMNPCLEHLQRRGIYTCYWVLNEPKELNYVIKKSKVEGIMTDRPEDL
jgi:hypothetical protein